MPRKRKNMSNPKFIGIYFEEQPSFISLEIESHRKAGTIRNITNDSVEVKFKTKDGTIFIRGNIVAHGGKNHIHLTFLSISPTRPGFPSNPTGLTRC